MIYKNMKSTIGLKDGGFEWTAEVVEVSQAKVDELVALGIKQVVQRVSETDEILGVSFRNADNKLERTGLKRSEVKFSESKAEQLAAAFNAAMTEFGDIRIVVTQSYGESPTKVFRNERNLLQSAKAAGKNLQAIADKVEFDGEIDFDEPSDEFLKAIKAWSDRQTAL